jgi:hypothetical protein
MSHRVLRVSLSLGRLRYVSAAAALQAGGTRLRPTKLHYDAIALPRHPQQRLSRRYVEQNC